jgi:flagellar P-ring protein precursor FlgI
VRAPAEESQRVGYIAHVENLEVEPADAPARVIINSRTGTVVIGSQVRVRPAAVAHGSLVVNITEFDLVSQPNAFSDGETVVVERSELGFQQEESRMFVFGPGATLNQIVEAVNQVGAAPGDLVAILEALKEAGALSAQLIVI